MRPRCGSARPASSDAEISALATSTVATRRCQSHGAQIPLTGYRRYRILLVQQEKMPRRISAHLLLLLASATDAFQEVPPAVTHDAAASESKCIFEGARLFNQTGRIVTCADLAGRSVAIYFAGEWCPLCRRFTPALREFYASFRESIEIVFVSSDETSHDAQKHYKHQLGLDGTHHHVDRAGWLALAFDDPLADELKRRHRVWSGREVHKFGSRRRAGVPSIVVIKPDGEEDSFIQGERFGAAALREWEPDARSAWARHSDHSDEL